LPPLPRCRSAPSLLSVSYLSFFHATPTTALYTLSLHDALPIFHRAVHRRDDDVQAAQQLVIVVQRAVGQNVDFRAGQDAEVVPRSEEHTSELQSRENLVCRLLLEKKKKQIKQSRQSHNAW